MEEAKKRIYACSTTTYNGFQVEMTEEMSEKFRGNSLCFINPFVFHFSISHNLEKDSVFLFSFILFYFNDRFARSCVCFTRFIPIP